MERTIKIANTKTQQRYTITTSATTLGELQDQMTAQGIDFDGMSFTEGLSKTTLINRDSLLPTNVMFKGHPTNDLIMLLTNTTKNIASGAVSRKEVYQLIKEHSLQDAVKEEFGRNYTQVPTMDLYTFAICNTDVMIEKEHPYYPEDVNLASEKPSDTEEEPEVNTPDVKTAPHADLVELIYLGVKYLTKTNNMVADDVAVIANLTTELYKRMEEESPKISDEDIDDLIANI